MRTVACGLVGLFIAWSCQAYPLVSSDPNNVELNVWNTNLAQAKAKARELNRPALIVMLDSVNCGYSRSFITGIADSPAFQSFIAENPLVLIMADKPKMVRDTWFSYTAPFRDPVTRMLFFPTVALFRPDGTVADQFLARGTLGGNPGFYTRVRNTTDLYPYSGTPPETSEDPPSFTSPGAGETHAFFAGAAVSLQLRAAGATPIAFSADGLPPGLILNPSTGLISGSTAAVGDWPVEVTALNAFGGDTAAFVLRVQAIPEDPSGTYQAFFYCDESLTPCGTLSLTASASGALTARALLDGRSHSFRGRWDAGTPTACLTTRSIAGELEFQVDGEGRLEGSLGDARLLGRRLDRDALPPYTGAYTALLPVAAAESNDAEVDNVPEGIGYLGFSVNSRGSVSYSGNLADGSRVSGSAYLTVFTGAELEALGITGVAADQTVALFPVYQALYGRRGSVGALVWLDGGASPLPTDNRVWLSATAWVYPGRSSSYTADGFTAAFDEGGFAETGAFFLRQQNLAETFAGLPFETEDGAVPLVAYRTTSVTLPAGNALRASLRASTTTGVFSGTLALFVDGAATSRTTRHAGALVPELGVGGGYYLVADTAPDGTRITRSKAIRIAP